MRPVVSVITLTYNQAEFLPECLESIRFQEGEFDLDHIIVDDASSDGTTRILEDYRAKYPDTTTILHHENNTGANQGMVEAYARAKGEFIALCEGDDFWVAPDKLSEQLTLMKRRPDLGLCYHDAILVHEDHLEWPTSRPGFGAPFQSLTDLLADNRAHTCTVMYRRISGLEFPDWYTGFTIGDWPNHAFHAANGPIGFINRPMAAYRLHRKGSWSAMKAKNRADELERMLRRLDSHFVFRYTDIIEATIARIQGEVELQAAA